MNTCDPKPFCEDRVERLAELEQALSLIHNALHAGNVQTAHELAHRALGIDGTKIDPSGPSFFRDFEKSFLTAVRKHNVAAAYVIFDQPDPQQPNLLRILMGGHAFSVQLLKSVWKEGAAAIGAPQVS